VDKSKCYSTDGQLYLKGAWAGHVKPFKFWWAHISRTCANSDHILYTGRPCPVPAQKWQITLKRGMVMVTWPPL